jgi:hypothetical protein
MFVFMVVMSPIFVSIFTFITTWISLLIPLLVPLLVLRLIARLASVGLITLDWGKGWGIVVWWERRVRMMTMRAPLRTLRRYVFITGSAVVTLLCKCVSLLLRKFLRLMPVHPVKALRLDQLIDLGSCDASENFLFVAKANGAVRLWNTKRL